MAKNGIEKALGTKKNHSGTPEQPLQGYFFLALQIRQVTKIEVFIRFQPNQRRSHVKQGYIILDLDGSQLFGHGTREIPDLLLTYPYMCRSAILAAYFLINYLILRPTNEDLIPEMKNREGLV